MTAATAHTASAEPTAADERTDRIAARATGLGIGLIAFMVVWLVAARITTQLIGQPAGAYTAMTIALTIGAVTTVAAARRLTSSIARSSIEPDQS